MPHAAFFTRKNTKLFNNTTNNTRKRENTVKFSITVLEEERLVVGSDFTDEDKTKLIESLEAKYDGKVGLIETRVFTPLLTKDGD